MHERQLIDNRNNDPTLVVLTEKELGAFGKAHSDLHFACITLASEIKENKLEEGYKAALLGLIESYTLDLTKSLGYEGVLEKEKAGRFQEIRALNNENRALRAQLGDKVSNEDIREGLKNMKARASKWAKSLGLYIRDVKFTEYAAVINLDPGISSIIFHDTDDTFLGLKKIREDKGYRFQIENRDAAMLCTESNLSLLKSEIREKFPSCNFSDLKVHSYGSQKGKNEYIEIQDIQFYVYDLNEFNDEETKQDKSDTD